MRRGKLGEVRKMRGNVGEEVGCEGLKGRKLGEL